MKSFRCRACGNQLYLENSLCYSCGSALGFSRAEREIVPVDDAGRYVDADGLVWHVCANLNLTGCTWLARHEGGQCSACDLTRTRPADTDAEGWGSSRTRRRPSATCWWSSTREGSPPTAWSSTCSPPAPRRARTW
ncbi:zinc-ribbon domain-containing protein [Nocardioides sambongensis]|uniref:zinc-ribbon domain-containing protein n=1 Tax=Nocardioides sambongensis TaxID=2589074 RepID=UPI001E5E774D|nr:zinc-ribbon domain-containing protein [Nocardioides sambongensis]